MKMYNATVEVARKAVDAEPDVDELMDQLAAYHAAVGSSQRGWVEARLSVPGETLLQATTTAMLVVEAAAGAPAIAAEVMTEEEFAAREGFTVEPDIVSTYEAAEMLRVSRQRVLQLAGDGRIQEVPTAGRGKVFTRSSVVALVGQERHGGRPPSNVGKLATPSRMGSAARTVK